jgi:hypothetical protein
MRHRYQDGTISGDCLTNDPEKLARGLLWRTALLSDQSRPLVGGEVPEREKFPGKCEVQTGKSQRCTATFNIMPLCARLK